jgi:hypothetical protein
VTPTTIDIAIKQIEEGSLTDSDAKNIGSGVNRYQDPDLIRRHFWLRHKVYKAWKPGTSKPGSKVTGYSAVHMLTIEELEREYECFYGESPPAEFP